jgi:CII-binding regulator of phage lambda lysogenization HflD
LSEALKFSTTDLEVWLERETKSIFVPVHTKAKKLVDEVRKALDSLIDTSKMLLDNSGKEIEKRNMRVYRRARALNKLARLFVERYRLLKVPEEVTYDSAETFVGEVQKAFTVTDFDVRNWFPRISPFFILDRRKFSAVLEKAKVTLKELEGFVSKEYVKTKTLEDTFQLIDKLMSLEKQLKELADKKAKAGAETSSIQKQIDEMQHRMDEMKNRGGITQLSQTGDEIALMLEEVKHSLQHLQKPFIKLQSLATHGSGSGLTPEELNKLAQYLENPFEALSTEEEGYPLLRQILLKLNRFLSEDKLKLKPEKVRKAEQVIINIIDNNSLTNLHQKCKDCQTRKTRLLTSAEVAATEKELAKLNEHMELLKRNRGVIEAEEFSISRNHTETLEKIRNHKDEIQKNVLSFLGRKIVVA